MTLLYEGKSKQVFTSNNDTEVLIKFKDSVTALNGQKEDIFENKAKVTSAINKYFFTIINNAVPNHIIAFSDDASFVAKKLTMIPIEVVVRNFAAGSICERKKYNRGEWFPYPLLEYFVKSDELSNPEISEGEIVNQRILNFDQIDVLIDYSRRVTQLIWTELISKKLYLVDIKFEFGRDPDGNIYLADEISPDTCRIWDVETRESFDKDVYKENKADLVDTYLKLAERLEIKA